MTTSAPDRAAARGGSFLVGPRRGPSAVFTPEQLSEEHRAIGEAVRLRRDAGRPAARRPSRAGTTRPTASCSRGSAPTATWASRCRRPTAAPGSTGSEPRRDRGDRSRPRLFAVTYLAHTGIGTLPLVFFGTEAQKRRYLPGLAAGTRGRRLLPHRARPPAPTRWACARGRLACPTAAGTSTAPSSSSPTPASPTCSRSTPRSTARHSAPSWSSATRPA